MRKIDDSSKKRCSVSLSSRADGRSRPNGFSRITRAPSAHCAAASPFATVSNRLGGIAR
jgi:hypothetical protein